VLDLLDEAQRPYEVRRELLADLFDFVEINQQPKADSVFTCNDWRADSFPDAWQMLQQVNQTWGCDFYEGVVAKRADSLYPLQLPDERGEDGVRPRQRLNTKAAFDGLVDEFVTGIADSGRSGVGDQSDIAVRQRVENRIELGELIVFMVTGQRRVDVIVIHQHPTGAGILRRDERDLLENPQGA
jgi:hypothetical protein